MRLFSFYTQVSDAGETHGFVTASVLSRNLSGGTKKCLLGEPVTRPRFEPGHHEYESLGHNFRFKLFLQGTKDISSNQN
jgi:hypothetical protein